jgi:hypothetical protein
MNKLAGATEAGAKKEVIADWVGKNGLVNIIYNVGKIKDMVFKTISVLIATLLQAFMEKLRPSFNYIKLLRVTRSVSLPCCMQTKKKPYRFFNGPVTNCPDG